MIVIRTHQFPSGSFTVAHPETEEEFEKYYDIRYRVLREPWGQPRGSERDLNENERHHFILVNGSKEIIGVCCLQQNSVEEGQVRYMAVEERYSGNKLGDCLLHAAEEKARQLKLKSIFLQARDNAVSFYKRNGYLVIEKTFLLFDSIQHYSMNKRI